MTVKETLEAIEVLPDDAVIVAEHFAADVTLGRASDLKALADRVPIAEKFTELAETAWGIIANAGEGDWLRESEEWQKAAARWREDYFKALAEIQGGEGE